jgi:lipopolysaccharide/colanic/teichoic acid biosynthesis glycosyltransferase
MLIIAVLVRLDSRGPALFRQQRVGRAGETFQILKFRTMREDAEKTGAQFAQENDPRITRIGRFLRKTRLDELPQLLNVVRGEMSFVGPRPERPEFVANLQEEIPYYYLRTVIRPGITGWAQIRYPYGETTRQHREKLEHDLYYIKNMSLALDTLIALDTLRVILFGHGSR